MDSSIEGEDYWHDYITRSSHSRNVSAEEKAFNKVIDMIWDKYDVDKSGELDRDETMAFIKATIGRSSK